MEKIKIEYNKIYFLDVIKYLDLVPDNSIDLIVADPPYNQSIADWDTFVSVENYLFFMEKWLIKTFLKLKNTGSIYLFNNPYNSALILPILTKIGYIYKNWIVWYKKDGFKPTKRGFVSNQEVLLFLTKSNEYTFNYNDIRTPYISSQRIKHASQKGILKNGKRWFPNPQGKLCTDIWEFSSERHKLKSGGKVTKLEHPTIKPKLIIERIIKASSNKGDIVMDLFSGSGMTSKVCVEQNRIFTGCENNKNYYEKIERDLNKNYEL